jgi:hypothetical protein
MSQRPWALDVSAAKPGHAQHCKEKLMNVKRYVVGMDFNGGSPVVTENDDYGEEHYPRDREPYRKWRFVREEDYEASLARIRALEATLYDVVHCSLEAGVVKRAEIALGLATAETKAESRCLCCGGKGFVFTYPNNQPRSMDCPSCSPENRSGVE